MTDSRHSSRLPTRYGYLLVSLLLLMLGPPFFGTTWFGIPVADALVVLTVAAGVYATAAARLPFLLCCGLGIVTIGTKAMLGEPPSDAMLVVVLGSMLLNFLLVALYVLRDVMAKATSVKADTLAGALSVYLLLGIAWAVGFTLLEFTDPGSFATADSPRIEAGDYERFIGFSFTTITTLGYGNISPASARADAMTTAEALIGQFYIAVIVARLVALQMVSPGGGDPRDRS